VSRALSTNLLPRAGLKQAGLTGFSPGTTDHQGFSWWEEASEARCRHVDLLSLIEPWQSGWETQLNKNRMWNGRIAELTAGAFSAASLKTGCFVAKMLKLL